MENGSIRAGEPKFVLESRATETHYDFERSSAIFFDAPCLEQFLGNKACLEFFSLYAIDLLLIDRSLSLILKNLSSILLIINIFPLSRLRHGSMDCS